MTPLGVEQGVEQHILTGEYPPQPGGVSDYTALVAAGLAAAGVPVQVWAPPAAGPTPAVPGVTVHRVAGRWSPADLRRLDQALQAFAPPRRLLVQYVPNAWGYRGLNLGFSRWLLRRSRQGDRIEAMVHEPFYPWQLRDKPTRWLLAAGHRRMIRAVLAASARVYVAIPDWERRLRPYAPRGRPPMIWLPIPSTIPVVDAAAEVAALRRRLAPQGQTILGSFSTYGPWVRGLLRRVWLSLLADHPGRVGLLLGRQGEQFAAELRAADPRLADRLIAPGGLAAAPTSLHLQACDLLVQPYPEGVTSRRTTVMAGLAHGRPTVTTLGGISEPVWAQSGAAALAPAAEPAALIATVEALLADPAARDRLGATARQVYQQHFALERTLETILEADRES
jgi:glycosyltransferase involved in cell wall biosynthesis